MPRKVGTGAKKLVKGEDVHSILETDNVEDGQKGYKSLLAAENGNGSYNI